MLSSQLKFRHFKGNYRTHVKVISASNLHHLRQQNETSFFI